MTRKLLIASTPVTLMTCLWQIAYGQLIIPVTQAGRSSGNSNSQES
jgi:hypothetical protein